MQLSQIMAHLSVWTPIITQFPLTAISSALIAKHINQIAQIHFPQSQQEQYKA